MDFPLSFLSSLTFLVLGLVTLELLLLAGGTKVTLFKALEKVLQEGRKSSYLRPVLSNADFWKLCNSSNLALEVLSNCALVHF